MKLCHAVVFLITSVALAPGGFFSTASASESNATHFRERSVAATIPALGQQGSGGRAGESPRPQLRVVTYNIRSCEGLDGHFRCDRIADILRRISPDVIALQEVRAEQAAEIAKRLGYNVFFGHADTVHGHDFGNAILTRLPIRETHLYPIGVPGRQQRACLRADIAWPAGNQTIHVFTVHLGLSVAERRAQGQRLASPQILADPSIQNEPRILLGDFNEKFNHQDVNRSLKPLLHLIGKKSWPAPLPFVDLDRIYFSGEMKRVSAHIYRSHGALIASDHAPLTAVLEKTAAFSAEGKARGIEFGLMREAK
jgi:endonuclease/exonuclease/phosphatase family metal-dependent hydrolase